MPLIPHSNTRFFHGEGADEFWIEGTLELLRRADALITTENWERSTGARGEVLEAKRLGLPVFNHVSELANWLGRIGR